MYMKIISNTAGKCDVYKERISKNDRNLVYIEIINSADGTNMVYLDMISSADDTNMVSIKITNQQN